MDRRRWLALSACTPFVGCATQASRKCVHPFIDAHVHLNDVSAQLELMKRHCIEQAVVFWGGKSDNDTVLSAARQHPGLIPFASVSPERSRWRRLWTSDVPALQRELAALLAGGEFKGIGEISAVHHPSAGFAETDFAPDGPACSAVAELAQQYRLPLMLHVELTRLAELSSLLRRYPGVTIIWAHGGYTPLFLARRMLERHPNLVYELSARTWPHHPRSPEYTLLQDGRRVWPQWLALIEALPERFVVGTDASQRSQAMDDMKASSVHNLLQQLAPGVRQQVARENLLRELGRGRS